MPARASNSEDSRALRNYKYLVGLTGLSAAHLQPRRPSWTRHKGPACYSRVCPSRQRALLLTPAAPQMGQKRHGRKPVSTLVARRLGSPSAPVSWKHPIRLWWRDHQGHQETSRAAAVHPVCGVSVGTRMHKYRLPSAGFLQANTQAGKGDKMTHGWRHDRLVIGLAKWKRSRPSASFHGGGAQSSNITHRALPL